jgi:hypothetical protein
MNKGQWLLLVVVALTATWLMAAGEYQKYDNVATMTVTTDSAGDSTLGGMTRRIVKVDGWSNSIQAMFILGNAYPAYAGLGVSDSAFIQLYAGFGDSLHVLTADTVAALPCTTYYAITANTDTLLKEYLTVRCSIFDTLGDSVMDVTYPLNYYIILK